MVSQITYKTNIFNKIKPIQAANKKSKLKYFDTEARFKTES